ncbi:uncharacterized protein LOC109717610 [Ananas comosus]|uniref:Uncharacterized protein LOC109717610 n=2 Tax=Ananas comosus TaxID=4615 RepID=A0A6P5FT14_ANACO|nr:uncharacterized protein LOC109717610 [Ananas comosus]XP_020099059.1 uncharacterized protein LOC109717610 [Ananas comosus]XP_020099060.1 uncharacterized protein LOC109717610 [Ananas comosus]
MEGGFRSTSYADARMQIQPYGNGPTTPPLPLPPPLRSYSTSYASSSPAPSRGAGEIEARRSKSFKNGWGFIDPELQRKKRVASYKAYSVEGKVKGSFRKSFRWFKDRYHEVLYGWW